MQHCNRLLAAATWSLERCFRARGQCTEPERSESARRRGPAESDRPRRRHETRRRCDSAYIQIQSSIRPLICDEPASESETPWQVRDSDSTESECFGRDSDANRGTGRVTHWQARAAPPNLKKKLDAGSGAPSRESRKFEQILCRLTGRVLSNRAGREI
jgi:hypothetical protein